MHLINKRDTKRFYFLEHSFTAALVMVTLSVTFAVCFGLLYPMHAYADVRKSDIVAGQTMETRGLSVSQMPNVSAECAIVMDDNGTIYFERDADTEHACASITKVMTAYTAAQYVDDSQVISVSNRAAMVGESSAALQSGDTLSFSEALKALLLPSGNDAAIAIAESVGKVILAQEGSANPTDEEGYERFVNAMNEQASALGMTHTVWRNPHGLDDGEWEGDQHSSARDLAVLAQKALTIDAIAQTVNTPSAELNITRAGTTVQLPVESTDILLGVVEGARGVKTGFTNKAGACFMGAVSRETANLYTVVLGANDDMQRFEDTKALWEWTYDNLVSYPLAHTDQTTHDELTNADVPYVADVALNAWMDKTVPASLGRPDASITVFALGGNVSQQADFDEVDGSVIAGQKVGTLTFYQQNEQIAQIDLVACESVSAPGFFEGIPIWWTRLVNGIFGMEVKATSELYNQTPLINEKAADAKSAA